jgi:hypothetical protein
MGLSFQSTSTTITKRDPKAYAKMADQFVGKWNLVETEGFEEVSSFMNV